MHGLVRVALPMCSGHIAQQRAHCARRPPGPLHAVCMTPGTLRVWVRAEQPHGRGDRAGLQPGEQL